MSKYWLADSTPAEYIIGVDLGQAQDYTAICVLQRDTRRDTTRQPATSESVYQVRHLERLPLGTPYPQQVERVGQVLERVKHQQDFEHTWPRPKPGTPRLVVDQTGVGRPVVDMLRQAGMRGLTAVTITAGDTPSRDGQDYRVPKRELVSVLQVLLQTDRLAVAAALPEAATLTQEMLAFKVTISKTGHDSYGNDWRENDHDDMVLAVALATWAGESIPRAAGRRNTRG